MHPIIFNLTEILFFPINYISYIFPRDKSIWVFGAWRGHRYSDNSRYLFEYVLKNEKEVQPIWLTRNREIIDLVRESGGEAYLVNSLKGIWFAFRASKTFINEGLDDVNVFGISGSQKIQLWHGSPLKKIGFDARNHFYDQQNQNIQWIRKFKDINPFHRWTKKHAEWDIVIAASNLTQSFLSSAFGLEISKVKVTGDPRGDVILSSNIRTPNPIQQIQRQFSTPKIILYAPTFRDGQYNYFEEINLPELAEILELANAVLFIKLHFIYRDVWEKQSDITQLERIHFLEDDLLMDINKFLPFTDVLITDYSSIYFDYLLLDRPIIFTPFDIDSYLSERGFYVDYFENTPGQKCETWDEIIDEIENIIIHNQDNYVKERSKIRKIYHRYLDTDSCKRLLSIVKD